MVNVSPSITHHDWNQRLALESWLFNHSKEDFLNQSRIELQTTKWGSVARDQSRQGEELLFRNIAIDEVAAKPLEMINNYDVRAFVLPANQEIRRELSSHFTLALKTQSWSIWERKGQ